MFIDILQHVPLWVFALLAYLIVQGVKQSATHRRELRRATLMPLAMAALSFYGVESAFSHELAALAAWVIGLGVAFVLSRAFGAWSGVRWLATERVLLVPGSWAPMALMLGIFVVKFAVNVLLAMHPSLASDAQFVAMTSLVYGGFSGAFLARGIAMWLAAKGTFESRSAA